jgi:uncharacterized membrane protein
MLIADGMDAGATGAVIGAVTGTDIGAVTGADIGAVTGTDIFSKRFHNQVQNTYINYEFNFL